MAARTFRQWSWSAVLLVCAIGLVATGCGDGDALLLTAEPPAAHTDLVFADEFDGTELNDENWDTTWWVGPIFQSELAWFTEESLSVRDGSLHITARREPASSLWDATDVRPLSTGQVSTTREFDHGTFEVRVRHEAGANLAQAAWMLPYPYHWPPEIDIVETRLSVDPATAFFNVYSGTSDAPVDEPTFVNFEQPLDGRWVTYRLVWDGPVMAWYVDGELVRSQSTDVAGVPMRLILDQSWIVPWSGDGPVSSQLPISMEIDYVRIWQ